MVHASHFSASGEGRAAIADQNTTQHPVEMVTWFDAVDFCIRLNQKESLKPTYFRIGGDRPSRGIGISITHRCRMGVHLPLGHNSQVLERRSMERFAIRCLDEREFKSKDAHCRRTRCKSVDFSMFAAMSGNGSKMLSRAKPILPIVNRRSILVLSVPHRQTASFAADVGSMVSPPVDFLNRVTIGRGKPLIAT